MKNTNGIEDTSLKSHKGELDVGAIFKRTEVIGRGKFGVVYKGYHIKTKQVYAIKVLNLDSDEDEVDDVQREIQFLSSMKQIPNITHYYGSYLKDTRLWIIIEYCAGGSLRTLLRPGKLDEKYIGVIMRELLIALKYIHKDNVIHRDIKAANVLISNEGQIKLCDFGVAAQLNQATSRRQTMAGTPYWMAPEVIMEGVYYDTKVDIWSLGITTFEIATGNPPYCEVEALRAMQLITKSKPPRLEGRNYSPLLKEFISLCLDEDPKERMSAEDLLKSKFIKAHKTTPVSILKQLISRYLLFREKNKSARESTFLMEDDANANPNGTNAKEASGNANEADPKALEVDVKWDFDSLSSSDYIMENHIDIEEIPEGSIQDWANPQNDQFNFAYPDEDQYYYYPTSNYNITGKVYQGTTMAKTQPTIYNSTLNAPSTHNNTIGNYPSKMVKATHSNNTLGTVSHSTTNKKSEARVPKKLLELFEENDPINEQGQTDSDLSRMNKNISHLQLGSLLEDNVTSPVTDTNTTRPHPSVMNNNAFHSQSTPVLPLLQTKFSMSSKGPSGSITTAPTPIEIEIPEELPTSARPTPSLNEKLPAPTSTQTKPRSSTMINNGGLPYNSAAGISRRLTLGNTSSRDIGAVNAKVEEDGTRGNTLNNFDVSKSNNATSSSGSTKFPLRSPSPSKMFLNNVSSPTRRHGGSPGNNNNSASTANVSSLVSPPTMKPIATYFESKELLLQPLNNANAANSSSSTTTSVGNTENSSGNEKEVSRVNRDFKRNNPHMKLHMPLPTAIAPNRLLDTATNPANINQANGPVSAPNENINQFGFNTSSATNVPVSMTPISERHVELGAGLAGSGTAGSGTKPKRVHSISNRKNSQSSEPFGLFASSASAANGSSSTSIVPQTPAAAAANATASSAGATTLPLSNSNLISTIATPSITSSLSLMQPPPTALNMDLFVDLDPNSLEKHQWVDRKPHLLQELELLLEMFDNGLPVIENTLKRQIQPSELMPDQD